LLTRFNVAWRGFASPRFGATPGLSREWLEDRFALFARFCAPSVAAQTEADFEWIIFCDPRTEPEDVRRIRAFDPRIRVVYYPPPKVVASGAGAGAPAEAAPILTTTEVAPLARPGAGVVVSTRLDNDDALHRHALRRVRSFVDRFLETGHPR